MSAGEYHSTVQREKTAAEQQIIRIISDRISGNRDVSEASYTMDDCARGVVEELRKAGFVIVRHTDTLAHR